MAKNNPDALLQRGFNHHSAGRRAEAEAAYRRALKSDPRNPDALHLLGLLKYQAGDFGEAAKLIRQAIEIKANFAPYHLNLGNALQEVGNFDEAAACFERALEIRPDLAAAYLNLGNLGKARGKFETAVANYRRGLAIDPNAGEILNNLGNTLLELIDYEGAEECYGKLVKIDPGNSEAWGQMGLSQLMGGNPRAAARSMKTAVQLEPGTLMHWSTMATCINQAAQSSMDAELEQDLLRCLEVEGMPHKLLVRPGIRLLKKNPDIFRLIDLAALDRDRLSAEVSSGKILAILAEPLLLLLMKRLVIEDPGIETLLTAVRRALLPIAGGGKAEIDSAWCETGFLFNLAEQCFMTEYAYYVSGGEWTWLGDLDLLISKKLAGGDEPPWAEMALFACYKPLRELSSARAETGNETWMSRNMPSGFENLVTRQIREPSAEAVIRRRIGTFSDIRDPVSAEVREQYQVNPYPRWSYLPPSIKLPMPRALKWFMPHLDMDDISLPTKPEMLVAGCGTGQDVLGYAVAFKGVQITAFDLSLDSLAFAQRKADEMGIKNIKFGHGDILEAGALSKKFDVINCTGVLHHMDDPLQGWRVLTDLLRPGGYMMIGLYSQAARSHVNLARAIIGNEGFTADAEGIRRFRKHMIGLPEDDEAKGIMGFKDFYTVSECRDLVFHVQEHQFTPPRIAECLDELSLKFLGFVFPANRSITRISQDFRKKFKAEADLTSLAQWDMFEQDNPSLFAGMYNFWLRKPG